MIGLDDSCRRQTILQLLEYHEHSIAIVYIAYISVCAILSHAVLLVILIIVRMTSSSTYDYNRWNPRETCGTFTEDWFPSNVEIQDCSSSSCFMEIVCVFFGLSLLGILPVSVRSQLKRSHQDEPPAVVMKCTRFTGRQTAYSSSWNSEGSEFPCDTASFDSQSQIEEPSVHQDDTYHPSLDQVNDSNLLVSNFAGDEHSTTPRPESSSLQISLEDTSYDCVLEDQIVVAHWPHSLLPEKSSDVLHGSVPREECKRRKSKSFQLPKLSLVEVSPDATTVQSESTEVSIVKSRKLSRLPSKLRQSLSEDEVLQTYSMSYLAHLYSS